MGLHRVAEEDRLYHLREELAHVSHHECAKGMAGKDGVLD